MMDTLVRAVFAVDSVDSATGLVRTSVSQPTWNNAHAGFAFPFETVLTAVEMCGMVTPLAGRKPLHLRVLYTTAFARGNKIMSTISAPQAAGLGVERCVVAE
jgi:hypothetical protein